MIALTGKYKLEYIQYKTQHIKTKHIKLDEHSDKRK